MCERALNRINRCRPNRSASERPASAAPDPARWLDYVFNRDNPRGPHREYWHHVAACRQWLVVERDTLTHAIGAVTLAREVAQ